MPTDLYVFQNRTMQIKFNATFKVKEYSKIK